MIPPALTHQFTLETPVESPDRGGGVSRSWNPIGVLWGAVTTRSTREELAGLRPSSVIRHRVVVRSAPVGSPQRPRADQRLRRGERIFAILGVTDHEMPGYLRLDVEEGAFQ
ncbi:MAG: head-tail adaptor protein [Pseudomonadota bacterium]